MALAEHRRSLWRKAPPPSLPDLERVFDQWRDSTRASVKGLMLLAGTGSRHLVMELFGGQYRMSEYGGKSYKSEDIIKRSPELDRKGLLVYMESELALPAAAPSPPVSVDF